MWRELPSLLLLVAIAAACKGTSTSPQGAPPVATVPRAPEPAPGGQEIPRPLLTELSLLTTGHAPTLETLDRWTRELATGAKTRDALIDELLADPRFAKRVLKNFLFESQMYVSIGKFGRHPGWILKKTDEATPIYYMTEPCTASEAEEVHPWWAMKTKVKVCPEAHRPNVFWLSKDRTCSSIWAQPGFESSEKKICGCGPNLMRCTPDMKMFEQLKRQWIDELEDTAADIVARDEPIAQVYLTNETVRKPMSELQYQIWRVERGEIKSLPDVLGTWPAGGKKAPRYEDEPGDHAGIMTTVGSSFTHVGLRAWMRAMQLSMWCTGFDNSHVEAKTLLDLARGGNANLRGGESWQKLAKDPVCGRCHARMDYGWQFFLGYSDVRVGAHFVPPKGKFANGLQMVTPSAEDMGIDARKINGKLFLEDFGDARGERPRYPLAYAKWAVEQPEFGACQSRRVVEHVFGRNATQEDREVIAATYEKSGGRMRAMMREALGRYFDRKLAEAAKPHDVAAPKFLAAMPANPSHAPDAMIPFMPETRQLMDKYCLDCHASQVDPYKNFDLPSLPRERMMLLLVYVSDGRMPKSTEGLEPGERRRFLATLVSNLWANEEARREAFAFYDSQMLAATVHLPDPALALVYERAGATPATEVSPMVEHTISAFEQQYTPNFAAHMSVEALRACKAAGARDLTACISRATQLENILRQ